MPLATRGAKTWRRCICALSGLVASVATTPGPQSVADNASSDLPTVTFDTRQDAQFGDATVPLGAFLRQPYNRPRHGPQHFCIVGYVAADGARSAQIHWREGRQLIRWSGATDDGWRRDSIILSNRRLDLTRDVVADTAVVNGSTYLVTRAWVERVLQDCARASTHYTLHR